MAKRRKNAGKGHVEAPTSSCLLICDDVLVSTGKNKHFLEGVIGAVGVASVPAVVGPYVAYIRLSNVYGGQEIVLSICNATDDEEVFRVMATSSEKSDPLETHTIILAIPPFEIRETGRYIFSASHGGVPFAQSMITIVVPEQKELS